MLLFKIQKKIVSILLRLFVLIRRIGTRFHQYLRNAWNIAAFGRLQAFAHASQDQFVHLLLYELLDKSDNGHYLEIGAGHPSSCNNSYSFEKYFWMERN